jgi:hypothetical protein
MAGDLELSLRPRPTPPKTSPNNCFADKTGKIAPKLASE